MWKLSANGIEIEWWGWEGVNQNNVFLKYTLLKILIIFLIYEMLFRESLWVP